MTKKINLRSFVLVIAYVFVLAAILTCCSHQYYPVPT